jgi:hypothetical protein
LELQGSADDFVIESSLIYAKPNYINGANHGNNYQHTAQCTEVPNLYYKHPIYDEVRTNALWFVHLYIGTLEESQGQIFKEKGH